MASQELYWAVDHFQLNASVASKGDCAILLLVKKDPKQTPAYGSIHFALLIDGGYTVKCTNLLLNTIKWIQEKYTQNGEAMDGKKTFFTLDAVILSHWDIDHYKGFCAKNDDTSFLTKTTLWKDQKHQHLKYDKNVPKTILYCQQWRATSKAATRGGDQNTVPHGGGEACLFAPAGTTNAEYKTFFNVCAETTGAQAGNTYAPCLRGVCDPDFLLGHNVFTGKGLSPGTWDTVDSMQELITKNDPWTKDITDDMKGAPALYIIGIAGKVFKKQSKGLGMVNLAPTGEKGEGAKNRNSLVEVLVWKKPTNVPLNFEPKVDLYTAGDAEQDIEELVSKWLSDVPNGISVMKSGHHGSRYGTSYQFIENMRPKHYLVTAGTEHGHPVPEILIYLDAWWSCKTGGMIDNMMSNRIQATCYPYHLAYIEDPDGSKNIRYFANELSVPEFMTTIKPDETKLKAGHKKQLAAYEIYRKQVLLWWTEDEDSKESNPFDTITKAYTKVVNDKTLSTPITKAETDYNLIEADKNYPDRRNAKEKAWEIVKAARAALFNQKVQTVSSVATKAWNTWSNVDYTYLPQASIKTAIVKNSKFNVLGYVLFTYREKEDVVVTYYPEIEDKKPPAKISKTAPKKNALLLRGSTGKDGSASTPLIHSSVSVRQEGKGRKRNAAEMEETTLTERPVFTLDEEQDIIMAEGADADGQTTDYGGLTEEDIAIIVQEYEKSARGQYNLRTRNVLTALGPLSAGTQFTISSSTFSDGQNILVLEADTNEDLFIRALQNSRLGVKCLVAINETWDATVTSDDPLLAWFSCFFSSPGLELTLDADFRIKGHNTNGMLPIMTNYTLEMRNDELSRNLIFVSSEVERSFNIEKGVAIPGILDEYGLLQDSVGLLLGLETSSNATFTLRELFTLMGLNLPIFLDGGAKFTITTESNSVNGLWFFPNDNYKTIAQLQFQPIQNTNTDSIFLGSYALPQLDFGDMTIMVRKTGHRNSTTDGIYLISYGRVLVKTTLQVLSNKTYATLDIQEDTITLGLRWDEINYNDFLSWVAKIFGYPLQTNAWSQFEKAMNCFNSTFNLRQSQLKLKHTGSDWDFDECSMDFEVDLPSSWGADPGQEIPLLLTLKLDKTGENYSVDFSGGLWQPGRQLNLDNLNPQGSMGMRLQPKARNPVFNMNVRKINGYNNIPAWLPGTITSLNMDINTDGTVGFEANIVGEQRPATWFYLSRVFLQTIYSGGQFNLKFGAVIVMRPRDLVSDPAILDVEFDINNGYAISAQVDGLSAACLYSHFPSSDNEAVMDLLEGIWINNFSIVYAAQDIPTFHASGQISVGGLILDLRYASLGKKGSNDVSWDFQADLSLASNFPTLEISLYELLGDVSLDIQSLLPDFFQSIEFDLAIDPTISLRVERKPDPFDSAVYYLLFSLEINSGSAKGKNTGLDLTFVQISRQSTNDTYQSTRKRLIKFTMESLPVVEDVPLLASLTQPFDEMYFLWSDQGLTDAEVSVLNTEVFAKDKNNIYYNDPAKFTVDPAIVNSSDPRESIVITPGCHFVIVAEENNTPTVILDYTFGQRELQAAQNPPDTIDDTVVLMAGNNVATTNGAAKAPWSKKLGPLSISSIGLTFDNSILQLTLDASISLGGVKAALKGFGIRVKVQNLHSFSLPDDPVLLQSIGLELIRPPIEIAGMLMHKDNSWLGAVDVGFMPYNFAAAGYYGKFNTDNPKGSYKTLFVFLMTAGPLIELELGALTGLTAGFGYNCDMRLPTVDNVTQFPFLALQGGMSQSDPLQTLTTLVGNDKSSWFAPANGPIWIAAGLSANAIQMLDVKSVMVLDITESVVIGLYGECIASIPDNITPDAELFAKVDMGFMAVLDYDHGVFLVEGQLTPRSFIFSPKCALIGGFALAYFFAGSGHEGDWVFSIGGYHPVYRPPTHYPRPVRLAVSWKFDEHIFIGGSAYFAVTPKVCMGGCAIKLEFQSGSLRASLDVWADLLVNYKPFYFMADIGVKVSVHYTAKVGAIHHTWDVNLGANLDLTGPPFAGVAHVKWHIISFDIHFGPKIKNQPKLNWSQFCDMIRDPVGPPAAITKDMNYGQEMHTFTSTAGLLTDTPQRPVTVLPPSGGVRNVNGSSGELVPPATLWTVDATTFAFSFMSAFPLSSIKVNGVVQSMPANPIYMKPMQIGKTSNVQSTLTIEIKDAGGSWPSFRVEILTKQVPSAIWGEYDATKDPGKGDQSKNSQTAALLDPQNATQPHVLGIQFKHPEPIESLDLIEFDVIKGCSIDVSPSDRRPHLTNYRDIPLQYRDFNGAVNDIKTSTGQLLSDAFSKSVHSWQPSFAYDNPETIRNWQTQRFQALDLIDCWTANCGATPGDTLGLNLAEFGKTTSPPIKWMNEFDKSGLPLPLLSVGGP